MAIQGNTDVMQKLKNAGIKPFKFTKDIGKALLFDSLPNHFKETMPAFETIKNTVENTVSTIGDIRAGGTDPLKKSVVNVIGGNETIDFAKKVANNLIKNVKSGALYNPDVDEFAGMFDDDSFDTFGGVSLNYDSDGNYIETPEDVHTDKIIQSDKNIAIANNIANDKRMSSLMEAMGSSTLAITKHSEAMNKANMTLTAKLHSEMLNASKNQLTMLSAIYEVSNKRLSEIQNVLVESNKTIINEIRELKEIYKESNGLNKKQTEEQEDLRPVVNGRFDFNTYLKYLKSQGGDSTFGMLASLIPTMASLLSMDTRRVNNPILYLTDILAGKIVPKNITKRMKRTNDAMGSFFPTLLNKLADSDNTLLSFFFFF